MERSESINELVAALAKAQGAMLPAARDSSASIRSAKGDYGYTFADLAAVMGACRAALASNGLAVIQPPETFAGGTVGLTTILAHSSGQWVSSVLELAFNPSSMQSLGSAITYARRYALQSMVGVVTDDDDDGAQAVAEPAVNGNGHTKPVIEIAPRRDAAANGNGKADRPPRNGGQLYGWLKDQGQLHEVDLVRYVDRWAKLQGFHRMMKEWSDDQVVVAVAEANRKLQSISTGHAETYEEALSS